MTRSGAVVRGRRDGRPHPFRDWQNSGHVQCSNRRVRLISGTQTGYNESGGFPVTPMLAPKSISAVTTGLPRPAALIKPLGALP